jgi:hypothetical protein
MMLARITNIVKDASYSEDDYDGDPAQEVDIAALAEYKLKATPLAGFVLEGVSPYGRPASTSRLVAAGLRSRNPTREETETVSRRVKDYQAIFDTH